MAPFPETEIMTIKRIEVALRKMDLKLLKDGAYKLHEKFHSGFNFEYIDILKEIKEEVEHSEEITQDIKGILIPTIQDILETSSNRPNVSSLTKLSYNTASQANEAVNEINSDSTTQNSTTATINNPTNSKPAKFDAFSAFGTSPAQNSTKTANTTTNSITTSTANQNTNSSINTQPFKEFQNFDRFNTPKQEATLISNNSNIINNTPLQNTQEHPRTTDNTTTTDTTENTSETTSPISQDELEEKFEKIANEIREEIKENLEKENNSTPNNAKFEFKREIEVQKPSINENNRFQEQAKTEISTPEKLKNISIYFHLNASSEKIKNIKRYRELITNDKTELNELLSLLNEINTQSNVNVGELKTILEHLTARENKVNLITNSSSSDFTHLLNSLGTDFSLFDFNQKLNIVPLLGLTNLFSCTNCDEEFLDTQFPSKTLIAQCPKCKSAMFPNLFAFNDDSSEINIEYYNCALSSLANSDVWLIIHPETNNKTELNMLKTALQISNSEKEIFIVDKDINIRENCKKMFQQIRKNTKINIQISAIEDFFKTI